MDVYGKCNWIKYHGVQWVQGSVGNHDEGSRRWPNKPPIAIWSAMNSLTDLEHSMHSMHSTLCPLGAASTVSGLNTVNTLDVFDGRFCKFASCIPCIPCWTWECFSTTFGTGAKRVNTNTSRYWKKMQEKWAQTLITTRRWPLQPGHSCLDPCNHPPPSGSAKMCDPEKFEQIGGLRTLMVCANELAWLI